MNISEMHVWFRQYAQQMGMQNVRAILPEQIDILINTSITDTLNDIIRRNIGISNDRIITDNSKIGQINALKFLYKVKEISFQESGYLLNISEQVVDNNYNKLKIFILVEAGEEYEQVFDIKDGNATDTEIQNWLISIGFTDVEVWAANNLHLSSTLHIKGLYSKSLQALNVSAKANSDYSYTVLVSANNPTEPYTSTNFEFKNKNYYSGLIKCKNALNDYLFLVDFSIDYSSTNRGFNEDQIAEYNDNFVSNYFPIRLIDDSYLADTLNDFILKPRLRSPIMVIYNNQMDIYLGKLLKSGNYYTLENGLVPKTVRMSYISKPKVVKYSEDINGANVDCDLPEYMHVDILKHAVDLYNISISGNLQAAKQQQDNQNRENVRNNANIYDDGNIRN